MRITHRVMVKPVRRLGMIDAHPHVMPVLATGIHVLAPVLAASPSPQESVTRTRLRRDAS